MSRTQTIALAVLVAIVAVAAGILAGRWWMQRQAGAQLGVTTATVLSPPRPLPPLALIDQDNRPFDAARLRGGWSFVFFGFTSCPDACPLTMTALAETNKLLADLPAPLRPRVVMISVDPERDTPERLAGYVKAFDPTFVGATGTKAAIDELAQRIGVLAMKRPLEDGALHALFSAPHTPKLIAEDYRRIAGA
jgi:protein SCO1/2